MNFIALIIALLFVQYWGSAQALHRDDWLDDVLARLRSSGLPVELEVAVALLMLPLLSLWVLSLVDAWVYGLPALALNLAILLYSFGRGDYLGTVTGYREHCRSADFEAAFLAAKDYFPYQPCDADVNDPERLHRWMKKRLAYMAFERWFAVVFYFVLLGAPGALLYRLCQLVSDRVEEPALDGLLQKVQHLLDWLPARLLVFAFSLTGDYVGSRELIKSSLQDWQLTSDQVISDAAHAALAFKSAVFTDKGDSESIAQISDWEVGQLHGLFSRSAIAWVAVISVVVVFS